MGEGERRSPGEVKPVRHEVRHLPSAEKQRGRQTGDQDGFQEISEKEHPEFHSAVLDEISDDLRLPLRKVEGDPLGFSQGRRQENKKSHRLNKDAPEGNPAPQVSPLAPHYFLQVHRPIDHDNADDRDAEGNLVGDHLRSSPQSTQHRVVIPGGKSGKDHSVDFQGQHRKDIEQRNIDFGDLEFNDAVA